MSAELLKLKENIQVKSGTGFPKKYQGHRSEVYPFYKVSDMNLIGNEINMDLSNNYISESIRSELKAFLFPAGTVIFPKVGGAILTNKKRIITKPSCLDNNLMGLVPDEGVILSKYLYYFMLSIDLYELSNKADPPSITQPTIQNLEISAADIPLQNETISKLDKAFDSINLAKSKIKKNFENIEDFKKSILFKSLNLNNE